MSQGAGSYAQRALESYAKGETGDFVLFGGMAIELAVKAKLSRENPLFLAPGNTFRSAIELHHSGGDMALVPSGTKTVGAMEAIDRLCQLQPDLRDVINPAREIVALRNGQAHMATADETQRRKVIVDFLRAIEALLQIEPEEFWDPHYDLVRAVLDEDSEETVRSVQERMTAARVAFDAGIAKLPDDQQSALFGIVENRVLSQVDDAETSLVSCPVCEWPALVSGATEQTGWDVDYDKEGFPESASPELTFFAGIIECEACGLVLDGNDEIEAAGLDSSWLNEDIDLDSWIRENLVEDDDWGS